MIVSRSWLCRLNSQCEQTCQLVPQLAASSHDLVAKTDDLFQLEHGELSIYMFYLGMASITLLFTEIQLCDRTIVIIFCKTNDISPIDTNTNSSVIKCI